MIAILEELQKFSSKLKATQQEQDKIQQAQIARFMGVKFVNSINKAKSLGELSQTMLGLNKASLIADSPELMNIVSSLANIKQAELTFGQNEEIFKERNKITEQLVGDQIVRVPGTDGKNISQKFRDTEMFKNITELHPSIVSESLMGAFNQLKEVTNYVSDPYAKDNVITRKYALNRDKTLEEVSRLVLRNGKVYDELKDSKNALPETMIPPEYYAALSERNKVKMHERLQTSQGPQYAWQPMPTYLKDNPTQPVILNVRSTKSGAMEFYDPLAKKVVDPSEVTSFYPKSLYSFFKDDFKGKDIQKLSKDKKAITASFFDAMDRNNPNISFEDINKEVAPILFKPSVDPTTGDNITPEQMLTNKLNGTKGWVDQEQYLRAVYDIAKQKGLADSIKASDGTTLTQYIELIDQYDAKITEGGIKRIREENKNIINKNPYSTQRTFPTVIQKP